MIYHSLAACILIILYFVTEIQCYELLGVTGIRMCERKCLAFHGCKGLAYDGNNLRCIIFTKKPLAKDSTIVRLVESLERDNLVCKSEMCNANEFCIRGRQQVQVCLPDETADFRGDLKGTVLLAPQDSSMEQRMILLDTSTRNTQHLNVTVKNLKALAYISGKLILCKTNPDRIHAHSLTSAFSEFEIWKKAEATHAAVDGDLKLIFFVISGVFAFRVIRMTDSGHGERTLFRHTGSYCFYMNLERKLKLVYVSLQRGIKWFDYEGNSVQSYDEGAFDHFFFDEFGFLINQDDCRYVNNMSYVDHVPRPVFRSDYCVREMKYYHRKIYMVPFFGFKLHIFDPVVNGVVFRFEDFKFEGTNKVKFAIVDL